ncbi:hypothetical protein F9L33_12300 [Amylibacter sp. SFDW26]|nr:hypothetical protein F9L33_12300 [Amylibacter sp. SFDW26]
MGNILNLKERTITFYISNACSKLNANTRAQAAVKAISENHIFM